MPRYFFNLRYGPAKLAVDPDGNDLADVPAARAHALAAASDLIARTRSDMVRDWPTCSFEIVDVAGLALLTVPFADTVVELERTCRSDTPPRGRYLPGSDQASVRASLNGKLPSNAPVSSVSLIS